MDERVEDQEIKREVGEKATISLSLEKDATSDLGDGIFECVVTTSSVDRHGESIVTGGIDASNWVDKNPVVLYGHDYWSLPIGKGLSWKQMANKAKCKFQLAVEEYPFAATVAALIKFGALNTVSIGGMVKKWSEDYKTILEMEMVEFSVVPVPANAEAIITSRAFQEATGKSLDQIRGEFREFAQRSSIVDKVSGMGEDEVNEAVKVLKSLTATLEQTAEAAAASKGDTNEEIRRVRRYVLQDSAKAVATQSQRIIKIIKLKP